MEGGIQFSTYNGTFMGSVPYAEMTVINEGVYLCRTGEQCQNLFGIAGDRGVVTGLTWKAITDVYDDLYFGRIAAEGQYPGYDLALGAG